MYLIDAVYGMVHPAGAPHARWYPDRIPPLRGALLHTSMSDKKSLTVFFDLL
jgi:hypothetical protein